MAELPAPYRLLICVNPIAGSTGQCCGKRGSVALAERLEAGVARRSIAVEVRRIICMNKCSFGPSMRIAPGGDFLLGVTEDDIPGILDRLEAMAGRREKTDVDLLFPGG